MPAPGETQGTPAAREKINMIILSVGMPRAGSGWHYNLIHDLMTDPRLCRGHRHPATDFTWKMC